jgi:hypothetical protein
VTNTQGCGDAKKHLLQLEGLREVFQPFNGLRAENAGEAVHVAVSTLERVSMGQLMSREIVGRNRKSRMVKAALYCQLLDLRLRLKGGLSQKSIRHVHFGNYLGGGLP